MSRVSQEHSLLRQVCVGLQTNVYIAAGCVLHYPAALAMLATPGFPCVTSPRPLLTLTTRDRQTDGRTDTRPLHARYLLDGACSGKDAETLSIFRNMHDAVSQQMIQFSNNDVTTLYELH